MQWTDTAPLFSLASLTDGRIGPLIPRGSPARCVCSCVLSVVQSLFGLPNYQADIVGRLSIPLEENKYGCAEYQPGFTPDEPSGKQAPVIALVARGGGCSFGTKALNAQKAGANAIVVYTTPGGVQYPLPKMAGGDDTLSINIPGMLINNLSQPNTQRAARTVSFDRPLVCGHSPLSL